MGAEHFIHYIATDKSADDTFAHLVQQAGWDFGHSGYTGTIAEKSDFIMVNMPTFPQTVEEATDFAEQVIGLGVTGSEAHSEHFDPRIDDKWGPAGCIKTSDGFVFFGWASS
jgi:hypothetical protein